ncbi:histone deacetylase family protein [Aureimonas pseudogalii]|uniref:Acetoin utilization deacetylase AcuC-like enzyme n=1 Tax=Aureimonas pseudogalii TaxID=1744844 RepID=A0A7W6H5B4_9HYPH|nr:histone deacetylase family protein [Aureimonas pseudogalii]MBB3998842.1 acetoin utilization deacetylase AcuC-like enzyme [Aureimonas pseudogalii]
MMTRLYHHPIFAEHLTGPGHPERPERMAAVAAALEDEAFQNLDRVLASEGSLDAVYRCHPHDHVRKIARSTPTEGMARIDGDTIVSPQSFAAALHAVGAACAAVDDVVSGAARNVFVAARPPGHHAERATAMGFCLFNQAAIAARHAQAVHGLERVAIVDWDVHHGNGTQDIVWSDPSILYVSTHQMPLYPGTGARSETGVGNVFNVPLREDDGTDEFRAAFREAVMPPLEAFRPDLVIISAGFDAHHRDPLGGLNLTEADFDWATGQLLDVASRHAGDRLVSLLEGGYDLQGLGRSVASHVKRLMIG